MSEQPAVGRSLRRTDARAKVTGEARYAVDHVLPDMLHGAPYTTPVGRVDEVQAAKMLNVCCIPIMDDFEGA